ncbi:MFS-type transporter SLC18B1 [Halotydeus destructor]|nr:MFS-type transporter SLC18B1 [Halotydeus destructor]
MEPVFPVEATSKGLSITTSGLIFSVYPLFGILTFPVVGRAIPRIGVKYLLMAGLCVIGVSQISFGALDLIDDSTVFLYSCFFVRALTSVGAALCSTCVTFQICQQFSDNLSLAFAFQETFAGFSRALGPQVAAICSSFGGYQLNFYVSGSVPLIILLVVYCQDMNIGFGALNGIDDAILFTVYCFLIRSLTSIGAAICITCVTYQIFERFPEHLSLAFAVNETSIGIGQALGPQVAAICEAIGGYELPYYVTGVIPLLILPYLVCEASTPEAPKKATEPIDHWKLCSWELVPISVALIVIGVSFAGFPGPTIEPHLKEISLSGSTISLILSGLTITYTVSSLLIGKFADRYHEPKKLMLAGSIVSAVCYLCLGPSPFTRLTNSLDSNLVSMLALGASLGVTTVPSFGVLLQALKKIGYEDNERTLGLVSAFWLTVYTFGEFLGTSFSGFLVDRLGFVASTQIVASLNAISAALFFIQLSLTRNENKLPLIESVEY